MTNETVLIVLALVSLFGFFLFVVTYVDKSKKLISLLILVRMIASFLLFSGLYLGWFKSNSIILSAVLPIAVTTLLLGVVELAIRKLKGKQEARSSKVD